VGLLDAARIAARGEVAGLGVPAKKKLLGFVELVDGLADVISQGASVAETIIQVVERSGMKAKLEDDNSSESRDRLENLAELVTMASDFDDETDEARTIDEFLERIALSSAGDQSADEQVVLMTIHIAKGLEWPVVFIAGMEDGLFPSLRARDGQSEDAALEEERRLAYVAITRARERLVLSLAHERRIWGETKGSIPSRFLRDLPPSTLATPVHARPQLPRGPRIVDGNFAQSSGQWRAPRTVGNRRGMGRGSRGDEFDQRTDFEEPVFRVEDADNDASQFAIGSTVSHQTLGPGRVVSVTGSGKDLKVVVDFGVIGQKTVYARYLHAADDSLN
jgi:DNA helicase-2/ATP-dependent DNA helicase PcrA